MCGCAFCCMQLVACLQRLLRAFPFEVRLGKTLPSKVITTKTTKEGMEPDIKSYSSRRVHNRILEIMAHTTRYAFKGESRLAADAGVSKSAVCRLVNGESSPSFAVVTALTGVLEKQVGKTLDPRELISFDGTYPTASVCELVDCRGCLPAEAYDEDDTLRPEFQGVRPGERPAVLRSRLTESTTASKESRHQSPHAPRSDREVK
jgi:transcriptional regulator with XRE-family HTH domain